MLDKEKKLELIGVVKADDKQIARLSASIDTNEENSDYVNQTIIDTEAYAQNREEVRKGISEFQDWVWDNQDAILAEQESDQKPTE